MQQFEDEPLKAVAAVADVARMVGLSRERFYQLQREGVFPMPLYNVNTRRPFYDERMQCECLEVRRRNCGVNGKPVLFYARGGWPPSKPLRRSPERSEQKRPTGTENAWLVDAVRGLGLEATEAEVAAAVKVCYPQGLGQEDRGRVIREVFITLKRQNRGDNVGG